MCELCSNDPDEKIKELNRIEEKAKRLDRLAARYWDLRMGSIKPHSKEAADIGITARATIRMLAEEWL